MGPDGRGRRVRSTYRCVRLTTTPTVSAAFPSAPYTHEHVFHEILVLFSHLAAVTERMELVTSVLVLPQRPDGARGQAGGHASTC